MPSRAEFSSDSRISSRDPSQSVGGGSQMLGAGLPGVPMGGGPPLVGVQPGDILPFQDHPELM